MSSINRFVFTGLFAICGAAFYSCGSDKESDTVAGNSGTTAGTGGSQSTPAAGGSQTVGAVGTGVAGNQTANAGGKSAGGSGGKVGGKAGAKTGTGGRGGSGARGAAGSVAAKPDAGGSGTLRPLATSLSLPTTMETPGVAPWFNVYRPTDLAAAVAATGQPLPIIAWANGGCYRSAFTWEPLYERWAAGGFVVLALDVGSDGNPLVMTTVDDQIALIDWALEQAEKEGSPYVGRLDTKRIVAAGNSCGGVTALGVAAKDKRVAAVFVLSGSSALGSTDANVMGAISVPVGYATGGTEDVSHAAVFADYEALPDGIPAMIVSRSSGDHVTVSTDTTILPQEAEMALNWMDLSLYGTKKACEALSSATVCSGCEPGVWTLTSKHLETLQK